ncbi:hypothetical protein GQ55_4G096700 [Panicum hallii var. hallii]|uniref:Peptidase A1 domain-containing protein n=1 Tax=Panicum hallii var. hallii TaxID=1504633 RepID=A0A2T7DWZ3_9POAL|nr:hypothetical protein GQ55_4G096700 [Panicum hallii var. hallii]
MANRRVTHALDVAFLVVILLPRMVRPAKFPRFTMTPRTKQQLRKFFKNHASDMADLLPSQGQEGGSSDDQSKPGTSGQSQAPATNAGMYLYSYSVGTPPQSVSGALDISSELLPCTSSTCQDFVAQTCSAGTPAECCYTYVYRGGEANTTGHLATEAFTFGASRVDGVVFGCGLDSTGDFGGAPGVIGLGRAPLSLVSQLQAGRAVSTLLASSDYPNAYLVGLAGVRVDGKDLAIQRGTFDLRKDGSGGVVLSIAVPVTFLEESAYKLLRQALVSRIRLPRSLATAKIPAVALVFDGGAVVELEVGNYFYMDAGSGLECLTILPSSAGGVSLLGSLIQAGTHMIYDIHGSTLAFESFEQASPPSNSSQVTSPPRRSSAPPPDSPALVAHFFWFWVIMYMVL